MDSAADQEKLLNALSRISNLSADTSTLTRVKANVHDMVEEVDLIEVKAILYQCKLCGAKPLRGGVSPGSRMLCGARTCMLSEKLMADTFKDMYKKLEQDALDYILKNITKRIIKHAQLIAVKPLRERRMLAQQFVEDLYQEYSIIEDDCMGMRQRLDTQAGRQRNDNRL